MSGQPEKVTAQRYLAVDEAALLSSEFIANSMGQIDANWASAKHAASRVTVVVSSASWVYSLMIFFLRFHLSFSP